MGTCQNCSTQKLDDEVGEMEDVSLGEAHKSFGLFEFTHCTTSRGLLKMSKVYGLPHLRF